MKMLHLLLYMHAFHRGTFRKTDSIHLHNGGVLGASLVRP